MCGSFRRAEDTACVARGRRPQAAIGSQHRGQGKRHGQGKPWQRPGNPHEAFFMTQPPRPAGVSLRGHVGPRSVWRGRCPASAGVISGVISRTVGRGSHPKDRSAAEDSRSGLTAGTDRGGERAPSEARALSRPSADPPQPTHTCFRRADLQHGSRGSGTTSRHLSSSHVG